MRKISIISLVAVLAATPMMAKADIIPITLLGETPGTITANTNVASTSYVQGAYNDLAGHINTNAAAINTLNGDGEGSVAAAIVAERTTSATLTNKTIDASSNTISNLQSGNFADGVIATSISSEASNSKLATEKAVADAIDGVNETVDNLNSNITQAAASSNGQLQLNIVQENGKITSISGSIADAYATSLDSSSDDAHLATAKAAYTYANSAASAAETAAKSYTDGKGVTVYTTWNASTSQVIALDALPAQS